MTAAHTLLLTYMYNNFAILQFVKLQRPCLFLKFIDVSISEQLVLYDIIQAPAAVIQIKISDGIRNRLVLNIYPPTPDIYHRAAMMMGPWHP